MHNLTIAGKTYQVAPKYAEGHVLTAPEAQVLNQTLFENLRNNFASKAKEGGTQTDFDKYAAEYSFGVRTGGASRDPVEVEAMALARDAVKKGLQAAGKKLTDFSAAVISATAAKLIETKPEYREAAKKRVAEMQEMAKSSTDGSADLLSILAEAKAAEADTSDEPTNGQPAPEGEAGGAVAGSGEADAGGESGETGEAGETNAEGTEETPNPGRRRAKKGE